MDKLPDAISIRVERPDDRDDVFALIQQAFATARVSDGTEQEHYLRLLVSPGFIVPLALVAEQDGRIVGHIMLTQSTIDGETATPVLVLSPLSVAPDVQGVGIGSALVRAALDEARRLGHTAVFLAGDTYYYGRFGFAPAARFGIALPAWIPPENHDNIMALELVPGALDGVRGEIQFPH